MVSLPNSAQLPGLTFRLYQGEQDLPILRDIFQSTHARDHDHVLETLEDFANKYRPSAHYDPCQDVQIAEIAGDSVAYSRVCRRQVEATGERIYALAWYIRPEWQGKYLDPVFLDLCQERAQQAIRQEAENAPASAVNGRGVYLLESEASDFQPELAHLLEENGFQAARLGSHMTCFDLQNIPDAPLPDGFEIRLVAPEHYRPIWEAMLDAFSGHPGFALPNEDDYAGWQQSTQFQPHLWQVAWDASGDVAGMVLNYITRDPSDLQAPATAWTEDICVRSAYRRRGLARALLARSMCMFRELGFTQTSLGVDLHNPDSAHVLYQAMGYRIVSTLTIYHKLVHL